MAKNLRSFLGQYTSVEPNLELYKDVQSELVFNPVITGQTRGYRITTDANFGDDYFRFRWVVPTGVTSATFHVWGGGGSGAESSQCQAGLGGGSGAYAYKQVDVSAGDTYTLCVSGAERHCCTRTFCSDGTTRLTDQGNGFISRGNRGMTAYVTGTGLTNFCAEGGSPGAAVCCGMLSSNSIVGCYPAAANRCCFTVKMENLLGRPVDDSDNDVFAAAKYYGADNGSKGIYACWQSSCCAFNGTDANRCGDKYFVPFPGGLAEYKRGITAKPSINGGVISAKSCNIIPQIHGDLMKIVNQGHPWGGCSNTAMIPGLGGLTSYTCGGTCCCGTVGGPPRISISYS